MLGNLGPMELMLVAGIALLLFGKNLPRVAGDLGRSWREFKNGLSDVGQSIDDAVYSPPALSHESNPIPATDSTTPSPT